MQPPLYNREDIQRIRFAFPSLTVYRAILQDPVLHALQKVLACLDAGQIDFHRLLELYGSFFYRLQSVHPSAQLSTHVAELILFDENAFSHACERQKPDGLEAALKNHTTKDLEHLQKIAGISPSALKTYISASFSLSELQKETIRTLPEWNSKPSSTDTAVQPALQTIFRQFHETSDWKELYKVLAEFHHQYGSGLFSRYIAFKWEVSDGKGRIVPIPTPDPVRLSDMIGYQEERACVIENTKRFLKGLPVNNMLLYGDRGTGKSSTVKALINEFHPLGLRIIELPKKHLSDFPAVIAAIRNRCHKYIIFVDDLAFEDNEESFTALKAALEGGIESKSVNTVIYATSNRRHLIKEKFSDRAGFQSSDAADEVRAADTMQEKLSFSDRFGMTVVFSAPGKDQYLEIVEGIAKNRGLCFDKEALHKEAIQWELWHNLRSPRTARQFIDWYEGR